MKRLLIGFLLALALTAGGASSALATGPDNHACGAVTGTAGSTTVFASPAFSGGCTGHP